MTTQSMIDANHVQLTRFLQELPRKAGERYRFKVTTLKVSRAGYLSSGEYRGIGLPLFYATATIVEPSGAAHTVGGVEFRCPSYRQARSWVFGAIPFSDTVSR